MRQITLRIQWTLIICLLLSAAGCSSLTVETQPVSASVLSREEGTEDIFNRIDKSPNSPKGYNELAAFYIKKARVTGDFSLNTTAQAAVDKALAIAPDDADARKFQASLAMTFHRFGETLAMGEKLRKDFPNDVSVFAILTDANNELGNYPAAVDSAQKMVDLKPNMASYARVGHIRSLHGDHDGAVEMFVLAARTADPMDREVQVWCLVQLASEKMKRGKYAEAERVFDEAAQVLPGYQAARLGKARSRAAQGDFETAVSILEEAQNEAANPDAAMLLSSIYTRLGNSEKADEQARVAEKLELEFGMPHDRKHLAMFWADRGVRLDEALTITQAEYSAQKDILSADALAWCLLKNGRITEAKTAIQEAMRLNTNDASILYHAGMIENAAGNKAEAKRLLTLSLSISPDFDPLQSLAARAELEKLN